MTKLNARVNQIRCLIKKESIVMDTVKDLLRKQRISHVKCFISLFNSVRNEIDACDRVLNARTQQRTWT